MMPKIELLSNPFRKKLIKSNKQTNYKLYENKKKSEKFTSQRSSEMVISTSVFMVFYE